MFCFAHLLTSQFDQQAVCDKLDVLLHEHAVHADQVARKRVCQELLLDGHGVRHDTVDLVLRQLLDQVRVHQAREVCVQALGKLTSKFRLILPSCYKGQKLIGKNLSVGKYAAKSIFMVISILN